MTEAEISALPPLLAIAAIVRERKSGLLRVQTDKITRQLTFKEGNATGAAANAKSETAGGFLQKKGKFTEAQVIQFLVMLKDGKTAPWAAAISIVRLPSDQEEALWKEYVGSIAAISAALPKAEVKFQETPPAASGRLLPGLRLLLAIAHALPTDVGQKLVPKLARENFVFLDEKLERTMEPLPLDPEEKGLLNVVRTNNVISEVYSSSFLDPDKIYSLLLAYTLVGLLRLESVAEISEKKFFASLGEKERALRNEVNALFGQLDRSSYYDWLGTQPEATLAEIEKVWNEKLNRYSSLPPEKFLQSSELSKHETIMKKLAEARMVLINPAKRSEYDAYLASGETGSFVERSLTIREEDWLRKGATQEASGESAQALSIYEEGMKELRDSSRLAAAFARVALKLKGPSDVAMRDRVIRELRRVVALPTSGGEAYEGLAIWLHEMKENEKATAAARKALSFTPYSRPTWELIDAIDPKNSTQWILTALQTYQGKSDYYQLLGIDQRSSATDVQKAYRQCTKRFHPDCFFDVADVALKEVAKEVYKRMIDAYVTLKHPEKRRTYDERLAAKTVVPPTVSVTKGADAPAPPPRSAPEDRAPKTAQGKRFFNLALDAIRMGKLDSAKLNLQFGLQLEPDCPLIKEKLAELTRR